MSRPSPSLARPLTLGPGLAQTRCFKFFSAQARPLQGTKHAHTSTYLSHPHTTAHNRPPPPTPAYTGTHPHIPARVVWKDEEMGEGNCERANDVIIDSKAVLYTNSRATRRCWGEKQPLKELTTKCTTQAMPKAMTTSCNKNHVVIQCNWEQS